MSRLCALKKPLRKSSKRHLKARQKLLNRARRALLGLGLPDTATRSSDSTSGSTLPSVRSFCIPTVPGQPCWEFEDPLGLGPDPFGYNPLEITVACLEMDYIKSEPIDISARSPGAQTSSLSAALRLNEWAADGPQLAIINDDGSDQFLFTHDRDSTNPQGYYGISGARPIMLHDRRRRESNNVDGYSNGNGLGSGFAVGSWIRDEAVTNNAAQLSASHQSSSYLPRHEASYMSNFKCCDTVFANLHDLATHHETHHRNSGSAPRNFSFSGDDTQQLLTQGFTSAPSIPLMSAQQPSMRAQPLGESSRRAQLETITDDDTMDMDMDGPQPFDPSSTGGGAQGQTDSMLQAISDLNLNYGLVGNPTVSSVNTPSLNTQQAGNLLGQNVSMNNAFGDMGNYGNLSMFANDMEFNFDFNSGQGMTIHDPASQLSTNLGGNPQDEFSMPVDSNLVNAIQQQALTGIPAAAILALQSPEDKKFKCPVVGCEKAYKNQNGLKYHKTHGHANQKIISNEDGTYSIVDPETSQPYPGSAGMEKEKPYKCERCNKRYKNLNGLKYHRTHSAPCNPELIRHALMQMPASVVNLQQLRNAPNQDWMS